MEGGEKEDVGMEQSREKGCVLRKLVTRGDGTFLTRDPSMMSSVCLGDDDTALSHPIVFKSRA